MNAELTAPILTFDRPGRLPLRHRVRLAVEVVGAYLSVRRSLARSGLPATLDAAREPCERAGSFWYCDSIDRGSVGYRLGAIVERVLRFLPDARCLMRSIVLVRMLARRGIGSTLVIGVASEPTFRAHAWVELDGFAVLPAHESEYQRLTEL